MDKRAKCCAMFRVLVGLAFLCVHSASVRAEESPGDSLIPDFYNDSMLTTSGIRLEDFENSSIDYFSGRLSRSAMDVSMPGDGGLALTVQRSYQSQQPYALPAATAVGVGWNMHFGWVEITDIAKMCSPLWTVSVLDNPVVHLPDGSTDVLGYTGLPMLDPTVPHYRGKSGMGIFCGAAINDDPLTSFILVDAAGRRYDLERWSAGGAVAGFSKTAKWFVRRITDRHGNWLWIDYALIGSGLGENVAPVRVTASDGREVVFDYTGGLLTRVSSAGETLVEYEYAPSASATGFHDLVRVILREELVWQYRYSGKQDAGAGSMIEARNPFGGTTSYVWQRVYFQTGDGKEENAAVAEVVQDAVDSPPATWRYSYTPAPRIGTRDMTEVQAPEGSYTYIHHSALGMRSGEVWMVGLKEKVIFRPADGSPERVEEFGWQGYCVSVEAYKRTNATGVWAAVDENYWGATLQWHATRIGDATWFVYHDDWDWRTDYLGQVQPQTTIMRGPDGVYHTINRRFQHDPANFLYFLPHQEWISQADYPNQSPQQTDFDAKGNPVRQFDRGYYTFLEWDEKGNLASTTRGLDGNRLQGLASVTRHADYHRGVARETIHPDGTRSYKEVDNFGRVLAATNREGVTTRYAYDGIGRVRHIDYPQGNDTVVEYAGNTTTLIRGAYRRDTRTDGLGRNLEEVHSDTVSGRAMRILRAYDARGQVIFTSHPNDPLRGTRTTYDDYGRILRVNHPGGERLYRYVSGVHTEVVDENGNVTRLYRHELEGPGKGELIRIESPEGIVTTIDRNEYGLPLRIAQGDGTRMTVRSNTYSSALVLLSSEDPESGVRTYGYDWAGNLTVIRRDDGVAGPVDHHYNLYDENDRLVRSWAPTNEVVLPGGEKQSFDVWLDFTWTAEGRPLRQSRHETVGYWRDGDLQGQSQRSSTWDHQYDANGNLVAESVLVNGQERAFSYAWDGNDRLRAMTYPDGHVLDYQPDAFGWPTRAGNYAEDVRYHETGQLAGFRYGNGRVMSLTVNDRYLVDGIAVAGIVDLAYVYDPVGNLTAIGDGRDAGESVTMSYDGMNRLLIANGSWGAGHFAYDVLGNIRSKDIGEDRLVLDYDERNRLTAVRGTREYGYAHDGFGNIVLRGDTRFGYDGLGNLMSVTLPDSTETRYQYDARGRRIATFRAGSVTYSLQANGDRLLYEFDTVSDNWQRNVYLGNLQIARSAYEFSCWDDIDGDGIPHCVEEEAGLDPRDPADALGDLDGDGLDNLDEFRRGTRLDHADTDSDGIADGVEVYFGLDPKRADADGDLDGDGLPNSVELARGMNPADPADGLADTDGDGLSNAEEYRLGTDWQRTDSDDDGISDGVEVAAGLDPRVADADADSDGDGLSNAWELANGLSPQDPTDAAADPDGDGVSTLDEFQRGSDPFVADTLPVVDHLFAATGGTFNFLSWPASTQARDYVVDHGVVGETGVQTTTPLTSNHFVHAGAPPDALYWYRVRARNHQGESSGPRKVFMAGVRQIYSTPAYLPSNVNGRLLSVKIAVAGGQHALLVTHDAVAGVFNIAVSREGRRFLQELRVPASENLWDLVASENGNALLVWGNYVSKQHVTYSGMRYSAADGNWGPVEQIAVLPATNAGFLRAHADEFGNFRVAYANRTSILNYYALGYAKEYYALYMASASGLQPWASEKLHEAWDASPEDLRFASSDRVLLHEHHNISGGYWTPEDRLHLFNRHEARWTRWQFATYPEVTRVDIDRDLLAYAVRGATDGSIYAAWICGEQCLQGNAVRVAATTIPEVNINRDVAPTVFAGIGLGQVYWISGGALMYAQGTTSRQGTFVWGKPLTLVSATQFSGSGRYFGRGRTQAHWVWRRTGIGHSESRADGSWSLPTFHSEFGVADAHADVAGNLVYVADTGTVFGGLERRRLPSVARVLDRDPVVSYSSVRGGKSTITHTVTLWADETANIFYTVVKGGVVEPERRYTGPFNVSFAKGASATLRVRGINMAERWSAPAEWQLQ